MENLTINQIDFIFFRLKENQKYLTINYFITICLTKQVKISNEMIVAILEFLCDEKLADKQPDSKGEFKYRITIKGLLFNGYEDRDKATDAENKRLDAVEIYQRGQADTLNDLTKWVAGGTVAAAVIAFLLLLWETRHFLLRLLHYFFC